MCLYQCINGELKLAESDCIKPCADPGGSCSGTNGDIVAIPCPPPFIMGIKEQPEGEKA